MSFEPIVLAAALGPDGFAVCNVVQDSDGTTGRSSPAAT
jgi:hypothetical protein